MQEKEGKTAQQLAFARDSYHLAELLGQEQGAEELAAQAQAVAVAAPVNDAKDMSVEKEKDALKRRLAELEEGERQGLESRYVFKCLRCIHATCAGFPPKSQRLQG